MLREAGGELRSERERMREREREREREGEKGADIDTYRIFLNTFTCTSCTRDILITGIVCCACKVV